MSQLTPDLVLMAINEGLMDEALDSIGTAVHNRRRFLAASKATMLKPGDTFYLVNISPKYLTGCRVKFRERDGMWLVCEMMEHASGKFPIGSVIRCRDSHVGTVRPQ